MEFSESYGSWKCPKDYLETCGFSHKMNISKIVFSNIDPFENIKLKGHFLERSWDMMDVNCFFEKRCRMILKKRGIKPNKCAFLMTCGKDTVGKCLGVANGWASMKIEVIEHIPQKSEKGEDSIFTADVFTSSYGYKQLAVSLPLGIYCKQFPSDKMPRGSV